MVPIYIQGLKRCPSIMVTGWCCRRTRHFGNAVLGDVIASLILTPALRFTAVHTISCAV